MKRKRKKWRNIVITANLVILSLIISICYTYVQQLQIKSENTIKSTFISMVSALRKTAGGYLISNQQSCDDWAGYINAHDMDIDEALDFLESANSIDGVMAHIIEYDTMTGYSTSCDENGVSTVDYSSYKENLEEVMYYLRNKEDGVFLTQTYINPIDGKETIGFCRNIELTKDHSCLLIRTIPFTNIAENWIFPSAYEDAELSLINKQGDYIIKSASMQNTNFYDFINQYVEITPEKTKLFISSVEKDGYFLFEVPEDEKETGYFVIVPALKTGNWYYVGYISKNSVDNNYVDFTLVIVVSVGLIFMIILNICYFLFINKQLLNSIEETERANEAKTRFLSSMSHDIRTPMNAIIGMTTLSANHINEPDYIRESLKKITLASNHLLTLINDILDISKVESGKLTLNPTVFSIAESMTNTINIVRSQIKEKEQDFNIYVKKVKHEYLFADELRLNQIFINLLTNAVKYTPNGGKISVELIQEKAENDNNIILKYIVSDNGMGMTEEFQKTMYNTFSRASDSRIDKIQGSGLGLAITKQMVELMGGTIECKSELKKGTTFTVTVEVQKGESPDDKIKLPSMQMLVIDDDEVFLETASEMLESMGLSADVAQNGRTAVKMAGRKDYSVIFIDWKMPDMNGVETINQMRKIVGKDVLIIVVSAYDWTEIEDDAVSSGVNGFISKPFFRSTVYSKIAELLHFKDSKEIRDDDDFDDFAGLHILIAEDNDINWEIISELLSGFDITSERAENGYIATEMVKKNNYDAIFMDIQMPVLNGKEATRMIRKSDDERLQKIPIIAMTADAFAEDIQDCIDAGMNGHVAKPVELKKIFDELQKAGFPKK
ncbi:MAG: response regulator [Ruminococcus sp.]|nr:response regulator [Ruminococcus sp.]